MPALGIHECCGAEGVSEGLEVSSFTCVGRRGGTPVAFAVVNELMEMMAKTRTFD